MNSTSPGEVELSRSAAVKSGTIHLSSRVSPTLLFAEHLMVAKLGTTGVKISMRKGA
ncbi:MULTISPECIES: hypothetical protein [unclassified Bradyrhizobium]|uniref:hypothetical protein n=1 Tax=unclassified Bradyrhizobium TaxID=2631580 RepID=UPI002478FE41|nr:MULTISPECIES: hypothetical protein [unclassified Bradyrhizobium]WGR72692.1 hypothetical protein MTX24_07170 [Bradyrhizobium sp. ISRA426]WGR77525.1 hypothetical protein MTX21_32120 [Bradyrhizobium sp. ISRA430]WGR87931.1 hypothetical protein MTX25_07170 [Bradyrhizobium sp. ISRA432]